MVFEKRFRGRLSTLGYLTIGLLAIPLVPTWTWGDNEPQPIPQRKDMCESEPGNQPKAEAKPPKDAPIANQDRGATATKADSTQERPKTRPAPRLIHPGLALNEPVMKELGLEQDSAVTAEIHKMNQDIVNEIQKGLSELSKAGGLKSGATIEIYANVVPKYVEALKKLLTPEQFTRLQQIHWQQAGLDALRDPELAKALNITADQQERLATADEDVEKQQAELNGQQKTLEKERKELADKGENVDEITVRIQGISEKKQNLGAERNTRYQQVLTAEQQTKLAELKGKPVEFPKRSVPVGGRPGTPTTARPGGLMALALREPILKELGINQDASELAEIRRLSEAHSRELLQQLRNEGAGGDQEKVQEIEGKVQAKYNVDLKKLLTPVQFVRLQQIQWQQLGTYVLYDVDIVNALGITKEQKDKIYALNYEMFQIRRKLLNPPDGGNGGVVSDEVQKKVDETKMETDKKINQILSEEQQKKLAEMKGKPFDMALLRVNPRKQD